MLHDQPLTLHRIIGGILPPDEPLGGAQVFGDLLRDLGL
jgi:hypothetical protein